MRGELAIEELEININKALQEKAVSIEQELRPEAHVESTNKLAALRAEKCACEKISELEKHIIVSRENVRIAKAAESIKQTKTKFSSKAKQLICDVVTADFIRSFDSELSSFGMSAVVNVAKGGNADASHVFTIKKNKPSLVLSEGELKIVSIAAFLCEIKTYKNHQPIIMDDPVSSLDHLYREKIAKRLVREAITRQSIIFTHDISFITEIINSVKMEQLQGNTVFNSVFTIFRSGQVAGGIKEGTPWRGSKITNRADELSKEARLLKSAKFADHEKYNRAAADLYGRLRETWESFIEQDLFLDTVNRGRNSIQTIRLGQIRVTEADCNTIEINMTKCSNWMTGHDKSRILDENRPEPEEILADIEVLRQLSLELKARRKEIADEAEPKCEVG
ncbi:AAA family ATPase [Pseudomonas neustonica]